MPDHLEEIEYCLTLLTSEQLQIRASTAERYLSARNWLMQEYNNAVEKRKVEKGDFPEHPKGTEGGEAPESGSGDRNAESGEV